MRILGIDPALHITGYGVIDINQRAISLVEAGIVMTQARQPLPERLKKIFLSMQKLIQDTQPKIVVLEKLYAHYRHPTTAFLLGQARGVICLVCAQQQVPLVEYAATRVKKAIVGKGLAPKGQVQRVVARMLGLKTIPQYNDITDALALAIAHAHALKAYR
ncbi:MAG: crossover junction endodeoxyribonuclease RuvC [Candidatus Omnitrophica bacterium]|nr:crossover junction endodeoxyribonuclease RuvC [Candidatus Omnitrophota bacterium]